MKKVLFFVLFAALLTPMAQAQISLGVKGGVTFSNMSQSDLFKDLYNSELRLGFAAGIMAEIPLGGRFAIQPEIFWAQKGENSRPKRDNIEGLLNGEPVYIWNDFTFNYIEIPILFKYKFRGQAVGGYLAVGPVISSALSGKVEFSLVDANGKVLKGIDGYPASGAGEIPLEFGTGALDDFKSSDFGFSFGGGLSFALGSGQLVADARYVLGFTNLDVDSDEDLSIKNRSIQVTVGYLFPLGGGGW